MEKVYLTYFNDKGLSPKAIKDIVFSKEDVVESVGTINKVGANCILRFEDDCNIKHDVVSVSTAKGWVMHSTRDAFNSMYRMTSKGMEVTVCADPSNFFHHFRDCTMAVYPKVKLSEFIELI